MMTNIIYPNLKTVYNIEDPQHLADIYTLDQDL